MKMALQTKSSGRKFYCAKCPFDATQEAELCSHLIKEHDIYIHFCNVCQKQFKSKFALKNHMRLHSGEKPYCCKICGKSYPQHAGLSYHISKHSHYA